MGMNVVSEWAIAIYGFKQRNRVLEPAGLSYEFGVVKHKLTLGHCTLPVYRSALSSNESSSADLEKLDESDLSWMDEDNSKYRKYMSKLDPADTKDQDHYRVLGLSSLRYEATANQIKMAYRQKVLRYHPDKGNAVEKDQRTEKIFGCIQKAYEQLGMSTERRRAYDSVDPKFDESIPSAGEVTKQNFFDVLGPVFERNARFSIVQPVPLLGDENSDRDYVNTFYDFWCNWSSWREFSYLDSEDKTKGEDKYERREIDKMNKAEREKYRKKDIRRISTLVDIAFEKDPRIVAFKEAERRLKEDAKTQKRLERERKEQERRAVEKAEEREREVERQAQLERDKKANQVKQKKKKQLAAQRKKLRELCLAANYWTEDGDKRLTAMEQVERICINAEHDEIGALCGRLADVRLFDDALAELQSCAKVEKTPITQINGHAAAKSSANTTTSDWSAVELQLLVKAVGIIPPGTAERWRLVAEYISNHGIQVGGRERTEKEVIKKVKMLNAVDSSSTSANQIKDNEALLRENGAALTSASATKANTGNETHTSPPTVILGAAPPPPAAADIWSAHQQKQLEAALKQILASDGQRWERIAELVDNKTKKDCIKRYKHLVELLKQAKNNKAA